MPAGPRDRRSGQRVKYRPPATGQTGQANVSPGAAGVRSGGTVIRQISAVMVPLTAMWSVVISGVVQCRLTSSPMRSAVRSLHGLREIEGGGAAGRGWRIRLQRRAEGRQQLPEAIAGARMAGDERKLHWSLIIRRSYGDIIGGRNAIRQFAELSASPKQKTHPIQKVR